MLTKRHLLRSAALASVAGAAAKKDYDDGTRSKTIIKDRD